MGAGYNVRINVSTLEDEKAVQKFLTQLREYESRAYEIEAQISISLEERAGLSTI
jgi:formiminotetrahydrofolate cyclodeaminase